MLNLMQSAHLKTSIPTMNQELNNCTEDILCSIGWCLYNATLNLRYSFVNKLFQRFFYSDIQEADTTGRL